MGDQQVLHHRGNYLVRRFHGGDTHRETIAAGEAHWSEPNDRVHRAVNVGKVLFEEVTTFFLDRPDADPQPEDA